MTLQTEGQLAAKSTRRRASLLAHVGGWMMTGVPSRKALADGDGVRVSGGVDRHNTTCEILGGLAFGMAVSAGRGRGVISPRGLPSCRSVPNWSNWSMGLLTEYQPRTCVEAAHEKRTKTRAGA